MKFAATLTVLVVAGTTLLSAGLITSVPSDGVTTSFQSDSAGSCLAVAGSSSNAGFSLSSNGSACLGPNSAFIGLGDNGDWNGLPFIADDSGSTTAMVNLGGLYSSVGGLMNYATFTPVTSFGPLDPTISAIAADGVTVLQSYDLATADPITTLGGVNQARFAGISTGTNDIKYFEISGSYIVMDDITLTTSGTPEPATFGSLLIGLTAMLFVAVRRRRLGYFAA